MSNNFALKEYFFMEFFLNESSWKALSERLKIKNFKNSPFLTLADTLMILLLDRFFMVLYKYDIVNNSYFPFSGVARVFEVALFKYLTFQIQLS